MDELLNFAKGPLFRFSIAVLFLGLARLVWLSLVNGFEAKSKGQDKTIPKQYVRKLTFGFLLPIRAFRIKPIYSIVSIVFHICLLLTPLLLFDHINLVNQAIGISWFSISMSKSIADILTIATIISGVVLLIMRLSNEASRFISRKQDYIWLIALIVPSVTGMICAQFSVKPETYNFFMLMHIVSGCLIFIFIPFTKIAHCILMPFSQWITARSWKFTQDGGENAAIAISKKGDNV